MADAHANLAVTTVATAPSPATTGVSLVVATGDGAKFPQSNPFIPFNVTVWPAGVNATTANAEIVRVTGISTDTFTIVRLQEGTSARTIGVGDQIALTITNKVLTDIEQAPMSRISSIMNIAHSWNAGTAMTSTGAPQFEHQGVIGRFCGLAGIHENNVKNLGIAGTYLARTIGGFGEPFSGWAGVAAMVGPYSAKNFSDVNTQLTATPAVPHPYHTLITHGLNDAAWYGFNTNATNHAFVRIGWKHAMRFILSRLRWGAMYGAYYDNSAVLQWDTPITFNGGLNAVQTGANSGPALHQWSVGDNGTGTMTFVIPTNFTGGVVSIAWTSQGNAWTTAQAITIGAGTVTLNNIADQNLNQFPAAGNYYLAVDDLSGGNLEYMLVTAGQGTTSLTVTRGQNGTTAVAHLANAQVSLLQTGARVDYTGTASSASGSLGLQCQGYGGSPVACVSRFVCTAADAGKTIIATVNGIVTSDTFTKVSFDSVGIEASEAPLVAIERIVRFAYASGNAVVTPAQYADLDTDTDTIVAEFTDHAKYICRPDTDTPVWLRSADLQTTMTASTTLIHVNVHDVATFLTLPNNTTFSISGERMTAVTITHVSGVDFTLDMVSTANRGVDGTTAGTHAIGLEVSDATWFHTDGIHPNAYGHAVRAQIIYDAFNSLASYATPRQIALGQGATSQENRVPHLGLVDGWYIQPPIGTGAAITPVLSVLYFMAFVVPQTCIVIGMACVLTAGGTATSARFGIYDLDATRGRPGAIIQEFGTVTTTVSGIRELTPVYKVLEPGLYFAAVVNQGTTSSIFKGTGTTGGLGIQMCVSAPAAGAAAVHAGFAQASVSSTLPANATAGEQSNVPIIFPHIRTKGYG